jgi:DNA-3-methyladenine glycosylase I
MAQARTPTRCGWCGSDPLYVDYHDREWGVPSRDDRHLFEMLILEGAQAGLSWITILRKRAAYREAYEGFDIARVARFDARRIERLLKNEGIVRNRLKLQSSVANARATLALQDQCGSLADYLWGFVDGRPQRNAWKSMRDVPACTPVSNALSKDLKRRGFGFVGSTIMYAFMQAVGMVNDHTTDCHRYRVVTRLGR